jgi:hypothetical protein
MLLLNFKEGAETDPGNYFIEHSTYESFLDNSSKSKVKKSVKR